MRLFDLQGPAGAKGVDAESVEDGMEGLERGRGGCEGEFFGDCECE